MASELLLPFGAELRSRLERVRARSSRSLLVLDTHTSGEPTRILLGGPPERTWATAADARDEIRARHDWLRRAASFEPRGHRGMFAAALLRLDRPDVPWGVVFCSADGYPDMCGHATIGVAAALVELGMLEAEDGVASIKLDTPGGLVPVRVELDEDGRPGHVTFRNRPAFFLERVAIKGPGGVPVNVAVAWGGQWYAFLDARPFGLRVELAEIDRLVSEAALVREELDRRVTRRHPETGEEVRRANIVWLGDPGPGADGRHVPVSPAGAFDRSPCGTGTSARLAVLRADRQLAPGEQFVSEGILGTRFVARIVDEVELGGVPAVVPEVRGQAWISGVAELWIDPDDPLGEGFLPGETHA